MSKTETQGRRGKVIALLGVAATIALAFGLAANTAMGAEGASAAGSATSGSASTSASMSGSATSGSVASVASASASAVVSASAGASATSIDISASQWADEFPCEYTSYWQSIYPGVNNPQTKYTWTEKMGKPCAWIAAIKSGNVKGAGCIGCHSTSFVNLFGEYGGGITAVDIETLKVQATDSITCYSCHGDQPGTMYISKTYIADAAKAGGIQTSDVNLVCAQCHALPSRAWEEKLGSTTEDFSFGVMGDTDSANWSTLQAGTDATSVYQWFVSQGIKNPKIVVGEMEFNQYYGSTMEQAGATCADCHMEQVTNDDGTTYTRHAWQGANTNTAIYQNCLKCHTDSTAEDMQAKVASTQEAYQAKLTQVTSLVAAAQSAIELSDADADTISAATDLWYQAKFYSMYGQDSSQGIHGMGNANTDYCWDNVSDLTAQIFAMVV